MQKYSELGNTYGIMNKKSTSQTELKGCLSGSFIVSEVEDESEEINENISLHFFNQFNNFLHLTIPFVCHFSNNNIDV